MRLLERLLLGIAALAIVVLLFFFLAAALVLGSILVVVLLVRLWWFKRSLGPAARADVITTEYTVIEREPPEQLRLENEPPQDPRREATELPPRRD